MRVIVFLKFPPKKKKKTLNPQNPTHKWEPFAYAFGKKFPSPRARGCLTGTFASVDITLRAGKIHVKSGELMGVVSDLLPVCNTCHVFCDLDSTGKRQFEKRLPGGTHVADLETSRESPKHIELSLY